MLAVWLLFAFCLTLIITHVVAYATDIGISTIEASTVVGIMGGANILGRLLMGPVSDNVGRKIPGVFCAVIGAVALVWLIYSHNLWMFYLFAVVFGFSWGGIGVTLASLVGDIFGGRSLGTIMGVLEIGFAMGSAIGPAVGGFVFDVTGNYILAFATAAAIMLIAGVLIALTKRETKV
jgi:MFS family permease